MMHKIVLQWKGHFLPFVKRSPLVICRGFFEMFKQIFTRIQTKRETISCFPQTTALLRQSQRGFHPNEFLEESMGETSRSTLQLALSGLAEGVDATFILRIQRMPLHTAASLCPKAPLKHLLAFSCTLKGLSRKGIKKEKIKSETTKESEKKTNLQTPLNGLPGLLLVRQNLIF